jgi:ribosomal protein S18 acetylase RimI-like enzyme
MHTRAVHNRTLGRIVLVRILRNGDTDAVASLFDRLGDASRAARFHGAKPRLSTAELACLAKVDSDHHVLVAHVSGDPSPAGMARLVRDATDRRGAEIAFEVADGYQGCGIGTLLVDMLLADARAAGFARVNALVQPSNRAALSLLRRVLGRPTVRIEGGETFVTATVVPTT